MNNNPGSELSRLAGSPDQLPLHGWIRLKVSRCDYGSTMAITVSRSICLTNASL
jgi:hypothetical protein